MKITHCYVMKRTLFNYIIRERDLCMFYIDQVSTNSPEFLESESRFREFINNFTDYSDQRSKLSGKITKRSNKANSYRIALIRIILHVEKTQNTKIEDLGSVETFDEINKIRAEKGFQQFNNDKNRFYSAALSEYERFLKDNLKIIDLEIENKINEEILEKETKNLVVDKSQLVKGQESRKKQVKYKSFYTYPRSINEALYAKEKADWRCEIQHTHTTFKTKSGKNYVETHHLIPLAYQDDYEMTIDLAANLVCLCSSCHRLLHHAIFNQKIEILKKLYENRKESLRKFGINVSFDELIEYYL